MSKNGFVDRTIKTREYYANELTGIARDVFGDRMEEKLQRAQRMYVQAGCPHGRSDNASEMLTKTLQWLEDGHKTVQLLRG